MEIIQLACDVVLDKNYIGIFLKYYYQYFYGI